MAENAGSIKAVRSPLIKPFYPALDGLRGLAFFAVFFFHYGPMTWAFSFFDWGWMGVDLFFVLSGFLITGILYDSLQKSDYFRTFYIRRALRIFPLFYGFWLAALLLTPLLHIEWTRDDFAFMAYLGNIVLLHPVGHGTLLTFRSLHGRPHAIYIELVHMWSLAIEEQFYLVWPAVMWFLRSPRKLLSFCIVVIVLTPVGRTLYMYLHPGLQSAEQLRANTLARTDTLMAGAALAIWLRVASPSVAKLRALSAFVLVASIMLLVILWRVEGVHPDSGQDTMIVSIGFTLLAFCCAAVLLGAIGLSSHMVRFLQWKPLAFTGRISYGLYLFHLFPTHYVSAKMTFLRAHHVAYLGFLATLAYSYAAAWLSFRFYESRFLRLKSKLAPDTTHIADPAPASV